MENLRDQWQSISIYVRSQACALLQAEEAKLRFELGKENYIGCTLIEVGEGPEGPLKRRLLGSLIADYVKLHDFLSHLSESLDEIQ